SVNLSAPVNATLGTSQGVGTIKNDDIGPDRYEVNDTSATATNFGNTNTVNQSSLTLHTAADVDYYTFTPNKNGNFKVTVTPTQGSGTLSLTVLNAQQAVVGSGQSQTGPVTLTASLSAGKPYTIKVLSPSGGLFVYNLTVSKANGGGALVFDTGDEGEELGD